MANNKTNVQTLVKGRATVKKVVGKVHDQVLVGADELIENSVNTGLKYQKMAVKAIKKSEPLVDKQIDIVFDTMEALQDQVKVGTKRFSKLIGFGTTAKFAKQTVKETVAKVEENVETVIKTVEKYTGKNIPTVKEVKSVAAKAAKKAQKNTAKVANSISNTATKGAKPVARKTAKAAKASKAKLTKAVKATRKAAPTKVVAKKVVAKKVVAKKAGKKVVSVKTVSTKGAEKLTKIKGIGPAVEKHLTVNGITTFKKLAATSPTRLKTIMEGVGPRYAQFDPTPWINAAAKIAK